MIGSSRALLQAAAAAAAGDWTDPDLENASYDSVSFSVAGEEANPTGFFFKDDGLKMYVVGNTGDDVNEYDLSTAWDISTASYLQNFSVAAEEASPQNLFFKPDGTKMYVSGAIGADVNEYDLSTAWDISTASYNSVSFSVAGQDSTPISLWFKPDGSKMYVLGFAGDDVNEYDLSTAWDVSTATFLQNFR
jgi:DNA-binding beta-propeller fold protein YncE